MGITGLVATGIAMSVVIITTGRSILPLVVLRIRAPACVSWFLGILILGTTYLGLGLSALLYTEAVVGAGVVLVLVAGSIRIRNWSVGKPHGWLNEWKTPWLLVPVAVSWVLLGIVVSPALPEDTLIYHLGYPWQCLQWHRIPSEKSPFFFSLPLVLDITFILPICIGDDRLAKWSVAGSMMAGGVFVAARLHSRGMGAASWLPLLLFCSIDTVLERPGNPAALPKNDIGCAAFLVVGALLWRDGSRFLGGVLLGGAAAVKLTCIPFIVAWVIWYPPVRLRSVAGLAALGLPLAPWIIKSWLMTGDPIFPMGWRVFDTPFWASTNQRAMEMTAGWSDVGDGRSTGQAIAWSEPWRRAVHLVAASPILLMTGLVRSFAAVALGSILTWQIGPLARYLIPGMWIATVDIVAGTARLGRGRSSLLHWTLAGAGVFQVVQNRDSADMLWAREPGRIESVREGILGTYGGMTSDLRAMRSPSMLHIGGWRSYLIPGKAFFNGYWGETPLIWHAVKVSRTTGEVRKNFRRLAISDIVVNVVSVEFVAAYQELFHWNPRMLKLYSDFCQSSLHVVASPLKVYRQNGGFYHLRFSSAGAVPASGNMPFTPGAEAAVSAARKMIWSGRLAEAQEALGVVRRSARHTGWFMTIQAQLYERQSKWDRVYAVLAEGEGNGYVDLHNLSTFGVAANVLGHHDQAIDAFARCAVTYDEAVGHRLNLVRSLVDRARTRIEHGGILEARRSLARAIGILAALRESQVTVDTHVLGELEKMVGTLSAKARSVLPDR